MASDGSWKRRVACTCFLLATAAGCTEGWYRDPRVPLAYDYPNVEAGGMGPAGKLHGVSPGIGAAPPHPVFFPVPLWPPANAAPEDPFAPQANAFSGSRTAPLPEEGPSLPQGSATR